MAVYTHLSHQEIAHIVGQFMIGTLKSFTGIKQGVENSNYIIETTQNKYILTIFEKRVNPQDLPFYMGLKLHLAKNGFACPMPMITKTNQLTTQYNGKTIAIISFLNGKDCKTWHKFHCYQVGEILAQMHETTKDFTMSLPNKLSIVGWQDLYQKCQKDSADTKSEITAILPKCQQHLLEIAELLPKNCPKGICHADLFPDNVLFHDHEVLSGVIDFYFACTDFWAYDLAITITAWCFTNEGKFRLDCARAMIEGYEKIRQLTQDEKKYFGVFLRGSALRFTLTRLYDWINQSPDALVKAKDPMQFFKILEFCAGLDSAQLFAPQ